MSWLARSLVNSFSGGGGDEGDGGETSKSKNGTGSHGGGEEEEEEEHQSLEPGTPTRGVKEDISELTQTLTRQFWGVASFLAPPPAAQTLPSPPISDDGRPRPSGASDEVEAGESPKFAGIRSDFAEIGGRFRSGISMLSGHKAVSEISKIAATLFASEEGDDEEEEEGNSGERGGVGEAVGVTDEVLAFVSNASMHPETWLDFPLLLDYDDSDDFYMSDAQEEHALAVERLSPRLAALRIELCPSHMSEGCFWKVYFVLVHPRLSKHDAELLSTPQIVQARAMLQDLQNRTRPNFERYEKDQSPKEPVATSIAPGESVTSPVYVIDEVTPPKALRTEEHTISVPSVLIETDKYPIQTTEVKVIEKSVIEETSVQAKHKSFPSDISEISIQKDEEDVDEWLEEETGEAGPSGGPIPLGNEEDVSFSDLEEDDDGVSTSSKSKNHSISSTKDSGWVQLNKKSEGAVTSDSSSQTRESNDWLDVDINAV